MSKERRRLSDHSVSRPGTGRCLLRGYRGKTPRRARVAGTEFMQARAIGLASISGRGWGKHRPRAVSVAKEQQGQIARGTGHVDPYTGRALAGWTHTCHTGRCVCVEANPLCEQSPQGHLVSLHFPGNLALTMPSRVQVPCQRGEPATSGISPACSRSFRQQRTMECPGSGSVVLREDVALCSRKTFTTAHRCVHQFQPVTGETRCGGARQNGG